MCKLINLLFIIIPCSMMITACDKPPVQVAEENLVVSTDAVNNSQLAGPSYDFKVTVESAMPPSGVTILVNVVGEADNRNYSSVAPQTTSDKTTSIRLAGLPLQQYCICTVRVTSKTKPSNTFVLTFKVIQK
jgi:hypothetical protein